MANIQLPALTTASLLSTSFASGRVGFLQTRPELGVTYGEYRSPGSLWAFYRPQDGYAELYVADPTGYKFIGIR